MEPKSILTDAELAALRERVRHRRSGGRRWVGWIVALLLAVCLGLLVAANHVERRAMDERVDLARRHANSAAERRVDAVRRRVDEAAQRAIDAGSTTNAAATSRFGDAGITAAVQAALAADPALSALPIDVTTRNGVVTLEGPAPNVQARVRASVLAGAPAGVARVDNRLVVVPGPYAHT